MEKPKFVRKNAHKVPIVRTYAEKHRLNEETKSLKSENERLRLDINKLIERNNEWEKEVRQLRGDAKSLSIVMPVSKEDLLAANWRESKDAKKSSPKKPPYTINWVVPPMGPSSGGHADIFRTIAYLESKGHTCHVYFYDPQKQSSLVEIRKNLERYTPIKAQIFYNEESMTDCDAIFATNWWSAYPVFNYKGNAKKYYYVQDFEPYFDPVGSYSTLAENTYKFGLRGLTLGKWLSQKLSKEYGMKCDYFELGTNSKEYNLTNTGPRKKVFFYTRPVTPRRGFELGILALEIFHKKHPEYEINLVGWDITPYEIPFPYVNNGILSVAKLNELYNECAAGLVLSFTNMSLLPLEMLAAGCIPVVNDAEHTRMVGYEKALKYADPNPQALADALGETIEKSDEQLQKQAADAVSITQKFEWADSNAKIDQILTRELS
jgi:glycosyltransferase involved in cell wall biosynthesis